MRKIFFTMIALFFFLVLPYTGNASTIFLLPQGGEYQIGDSFIKDLYIDTEGQKINMIEAKINFDQDLLEAVDVITGSSVIKLWVQTPVISNQNGSIKFIGGTPNGYIGSDIIFKIIFKAKKTGSHKSYLSDTKVLLNDGKATEDELIIPDGFCNITEKLDDSVKIRNESSPDENVWISNDTFTLHWDLADEAEYSYILSKDNSVEPDEISDKPEGELVWMGSMSYEGLEDGIYYFHVKQKLSPEDWSPKTTTRTMIDKTSPEEFELQIVDLEGVQYLIFDTMDATSGMSHYEVLEFNLGGNFSGRKESQWKVVLSPYLLEDQSLRSTIRVKAVDKAGNERFAEIIPVPIPKLYVCQIAFLMVVFILITSFIIRKQFFKKGIIRNSNK